jgi:hypothetical protein
MFSLMFLMSFHIALGQYQLRGVERVEINSTTSLMADTCTLHLPAMMRGQALDVEKVIKRGGKVTVRLGYDNDLRTEYVGYVKAIKPNAPMVIECEDALYLTRRDIPSKVFQNTTAEEVAKYVVDELNKQLSKDLQLSFKSSANGFQFRTFTIHQAQGFEVLDELRQQTGLAIFARENTLHLHPQFGYNAGQEVIYDFGQNLEDGSSLEYTLAEQYKVLVKVVGKDAKGKKVEAEAGEKGGDVRTLNRPGISDYNTLAKVAKEVLKQTQYEGYRGAVRGWLQPYCEVGYSAKIKDRGYPEREGKYYVTGVQTLFSSQGGIRTVSLGLKLS